MKTLAVHRSQTMSREYMRCSSLPVMSHGRCSCVVSPFLVSRILGNPEYPKAQRVGTGRNTKPILVTMINAYIIGYSPDSPTMDAQALIVDSNGTYSLGVIQSQLSVSATDTSATIAGKVVAAITTTSLFYGIPSIDNFIWVVSTPDAVAASIAAAIPPAPSSYQTIVSQTGTAAPAVSGSLAPVSTYAAGTTFTWARTSAGVYTLTASTAVFNTAGKTGVFVGGLNNLNGSYKYVVTSSTVITFTFAVQSLGVLGLLGFTATPTDALLTQTMIYVQTYV